MLQKSTIYWTEPVPYQVQAGIEEISAAMTLVNDPDFEGEVPDFTNALEQYGKQQVVQWKFVLSTFSALTEGRYRALLRDGMNYYEEQTGRSIGEDADYDEYTAVADSVIYMATGIAAIECFYTRSWLVADNPVFDLDGEDTSIPWLLGLKDQNWYDPSWVLSSVPPDLIRILGMESQALNGRFFFSP